MPRVVGTADNVRVNCRKKKFRLRLFQPAMNRWTIEQVMTDISRKRRGQRRKCVDELIFPTFSFTLMKIAAVVATRGAVVDHITPLAF